MHIELSDEFDDAREIYELSTIKECFGTRINGFILTPKHCCAETNEERQTNNDRYIQLVDDFQNSIQLKDGNFGFTSNNIIYQFGPPEGLNQLFEPLQPGNYQPDYDGICLLRDSKNSTLSVDTLWNYTQDSMADFYPFSSCTILALNAKTLQNVRIKVRIDFCDRRGFGIAAETTIEYCFKLDEIIASHEHIMNGSPIFCDDLGFIGRV